jgi:hypothetical protein
MQDARSSHEMLEESAALCRQVQLSHFNTQGTEVSSCFGGKSVLVAPANSQTSMC